MVESPEIFFALFRQIRQFSINLFLLKISFIFSYDFSNILNISMGIKKNVLSVKSYKCQVKI